MTLQGGSKCAFCERKLESLAFGKGEQAVEHFRPKGAIKAWPVPGDLTAKGVKASNPPSKKGYHLLAYDVFNYSAACNPCNSALKRNYFPIAGKYAINGETPEKLVGERPFLIYPLGDFDDEPEALIHFNGVLPCATARSGHPKLRALVTIEFFQLDSPRRQNLILERARVITVLFQVLQRLAAATNRPDQEKLGKTVDGLTAVMAPHANCARSFCRIYRADPDQAKAVADLAEDLVVSKS
jgi:hypothetical protein